jgi:hypothetical protein
MSNEAFVLLWLFYAAVAVTVGMILDHRCERKRRRVYAVDGN